ncbi:MAG: transcriptional regulator [Phycisphaerales bacterium]|nr:MAG: transcriptional regulator [Phycisphaerales bacterium]
MAREGAQKASPGPMLIRGMRQLRDSLEAGNVSDRFTMRTVEMILAPREYTPDEILKIRDSLRASQGVFAMLLGVSISTVQAWEQGANPPNPTARRLLDTIAEDPASWKQKLREAAAQPA